MTTSQLGRPVGASGEQTRERIIAATMRCVADVGYSRATIRQIARTAAMTSGSLYNYFPNKSALLEAAIAARGEIALPRLRRASRQHGGVLDRIEAVLDESGQLMREYPDLAAFEWAIRAEGAIALHPGETVEGGFQALREIVAGIIEDAYPHDAQEKDLDARAAVDVIYALLYGLSEMAATASADAYQQTLSAAKHLIRGTLFTRAGSRTCQADHG